MDMAKIGIVCLDLSVIGGAEQVAVNLANSFVNEHEVHMISVYLKGEKIAYTLNEKVHTEVILSQEERLRNAIQYFREPFREYMRANEIEIVLLIGDYPGIIALSAKRGLSAKFVFCEHGALMNQWKEKDIRFIRFYNAIRANRIITLTKSSRDSYIQKFHIRKKKVDYIYNWIDESIQREVSKYDENSCKIMSVGRFGLEKGQDLLVQVARKVLPLHPEWTWDVYGDGETFQEISNKVKKLGLENQLVLKGNDPNVKTQYAKYAFFVLTSYREGLPLVLLEAKANHLPMVSFDILTGPSEIIEEDGFLIPPYEIEEMSKKVLELMEKAELRKKLSENTEKSIDKFSQNHILKQWKTIIQEMTK